MTGHDKHLLVASILTMFLVFHCYPLLHVFPILSYTWRSSMRVRGDYRAQSENYTGFLAFYSARYIFNGLHALVDCMGLASVILYSDAIKALGRWREKTTFAACKKILDPVYSLPAFIGGNIVLMLCTYGGRVFELYHLLLGWHESAGDLKLLEAWTGEKVTQAEGTPKPVTLFIAINIVSALIAAVKGALIAVVYRYYLSIKAQRRKQAAAAPAESRGVELQPLPSGSKNSRQQSSADMGQASSSRASDADLPLVQRKSSADSDEQVVVLYSADMASERSETKLARSFLDVDTICGSSIVLLPVESEEKLAVASVRAQLRRSPTSPEEAGKAPGTAHESASVAFEIHSPRGHAGTSSAGRVASRSKHDVGTRAATATRVNHGEPSTSTGFLVAAGASKTSHAKRYGLRKSTKRVKNVGKGAVQSTSVFLGKVGHKVGKFISKHGGKKHRK